MSELSDEDKTPVMRIGRAAEPGAELGAATVVAETKPIETPPSVRERLEIGIASALITSVSLPAGREASLVRTKLEEALMWLGRVPV